MKKYVLYNSVVPGAYKQVTDIKLQTHFCLGSTSGYRSTFGDSTVVYHQSGYSPLHSF